MPYKINVFTSGDNHGQTRYIMAIHFCMVYPMLTAWQWTNQIASFCVSVYGFSRMQP